MKHSRAVKYSPREEAYMAASRLINARIRSARTGYEARERARLSDDPALRNAAVIMDAFDRDFPDGLNQVVAQRYAAMAPSGEVGTDPSTTDHRRPAPPPGGAA